MLKEGTSSYTLIKEKYDAFINMKLPKSVKGCHKFSGMIDFQSFFLKDLRKHTNICSIEEK